MNGEISFFLLQVVSWFNGFHFLEVYKPKRRYKIEVKE